MKHTLTILLLLPLLSFGQGIKRSVISSFGDSYSSSNLKVTSTFGQPPNAGTISNGTNTIRQGFQQPILCEDVIASFAINDSLQCVVGNEFIFTFTGDEHPSNTYLWNVGATTVSVDSFSMSYSVVGTHSVGFWLQQGACADSAFSSIEIADTFSVSSQVQDPLCFDATNGSISVEVVGGTQPYNYNWNWGMSFEDSLHNIGSGTYQLIVTDAAGCENTYYFGLTNPDLPMIDGELINVSCYGGTDGAIDVTLSNAVAPVNFNWSDGNAFEDNVNVTAGTYDLMIIDANGCSNSETFTITEPQELYVSTEVMEASCEYINDGSISTTILGGVMPYEASWSNGEYGEELYAVLPDDYTLTVTDDNNCVRIDTISVGFVDGDECFEIPTVFTPNGDGVNEVWELDGIVMFPDCKVQVFNRWGQLLFESDGYANAWDGTYQGKELPIADYYYLIDLGNDSELLNGAVTIKR